MNQHRRSSLALLAVVSTVATLPMHTLRANSPLLAQILATPTPTFDQLETVAPGTTVTIDGDPSMLGLNQSLGSAFEQRYPDTEVTASTSGDEQALQALQAGDIDLAALGRALSEAEQDPELTSIPVTREKIAIIVGRDHPFEGDLTFESFAAMFRGDITNWAEVGGPNLPIRFVDRPADSSTRLALADYEIFSNQPFETGDNAVEVETDDTAAVVRELGNDGISYAIASEVLGQAAVRPLSLHNTLPDDDRYPYSQPRNYIYQGEPSLPVEAFLGFATSDEGQAAIAAAQQIASANVTVGASQLPGGVALAPDGRYMVRGSETGQLQWLDAEGNPTGTEIADAHRGAVSAIVVSPDGQTVVSSGAEGTLRRWDRNGTPLGEPMQGQGGPILALAISPDGQTLASGNADGTVERWTLAAVERLALADGSSLGAPIAAHEGPVQALHYPAGGQALISGGSGGDLGFWNADGTAAGQNAEAHQGGVTNITSSPDGQVITTTGGDGTLRNWDRSTLQPRGETIQAHEGLVSAVAYSPDGGTLATAGADSTLQLWAADGTPRLADPVSLDAPAASLAYTPAGQLVVGDRDRNIARRDSQGDLIADGAGLAAEPGAATEADPGTATGDFWQRLQNLPPSTWWMLAAIPALLLVAGIVGALLGSKRDDDDSGDSDDDLLEADLTPGPGAGIDFSAVGRPPATLGPGELPEVGEAGLLPPEAALVPGGGDSFAANSPSQLEQARLDLAEGRRLIQADRHDRALIYFNRAVEATEAERSQAEATGVPAQGLNATAAQAQAQRGIALALLGEANDAMDSFNAALALDASGVEAWVGKGQLLSTMGRYEEAIFCFDTALELDPTAADAWRGKGQALVNLGRQGEAQTCFDRAAALTTAVPGSAAGLTPLPYPSEGERSDWGSSGEEIGSMESEYPSADGDPDVPLELQRVVQGLPSADVELFGQSFGQNFGGEDVPPALAAEAAGLPSQAEGAGVANSGATGAVAITAGPLPPDDETADLGVPSGTPAGSVPPARVTAEPEPGAAMGTGLTLSPLEDQLISQIHLGKAADLDANQNPETAELPPENRGAAAPVDGMPPLRPAPLPVPPPVPVEPGDYVPPPQSVADHAGADLEGLPPEVVAALASIPPSSPDSFGAAAVTAAPAEPDEPEPASWIRLSVDREGDRFYAVWQIDGSDRTRAQAQGGTTMTLRLYDVTGHATNAPLPDAVAEQLCRDDFAQDWYLPIPQWDRIYVAEVGYLSPDGDWQPIAESAEVAAISPQA
ncbi:MAG: tetratricopeptide repeat protein [Leptolyngbya sp. DLM2.Bin27]|nr:MAG: tetratricopeptide repeat protein [Leptolyngbya sp. DLM2.Bin27]